IKYGLTDTCVDSTRKVRKKGIKRGPYKRRQPPTQLTSISASTTPVISHAIPNHGGYLSEPTSQLNSPVQSHMIPPYQTNHLPPHLSGSMDSFGYESNS